MFIWGFYFNAESFLINYSHLLALKYNYWSNFYCPLKPSTKLLNFQKRITIHSMIIMKVSKKNSFEKLKYDITYFI